MKFTIFFVHEKKAINKRTLRTLVSCGNCAKIIYVSFFKFNCVKNKRWILK